MTEKDLFAFAHAHRDEVVWMSQNTNTIPLSPAIREAVEAAMDAREYNLYPYRPGVFGLPEAIRADLAMEDAALHLTNGGIEGLYMAMRALLRKGDEVVATDPSFLPIHAQMTMSKATPVEVPIYGEPWKLTPEGVAAAVTPRTKMLLLIDPHNPLGCGYSEGEVKAFAELARDHDLLLMDDVTYRDFNPDHAVAWPHYPEGTLVSYSFSKGAGLAGMRVGALLGPANLMDEIVRYDTNVLGVNVLAQRAALAALESRKEWIDDLRRITRANQEAIREAVKGVDGAFLPVFPSRGNMFCIDLSGAGVSPDAVEERLLFDHKVHVRAGGYLSRRFGERFVRLSFSVPEEQCRRFCEAFPAVVEELRP
jgi:aspartate/methionine/tyrosine aminotransferase